MDRRTVFDAVVGTVLLGVEPLQAWAANDSHEEKAERLSVTVAFGVAPNIAQPGRAAGHRGLTRVIRVRRGGVVNFVVAGFHQLTVYFPGVTPQSVALPPATALFIDDDHSLYFRGVAPAGGPSGTPVTANPSNASDRVESVSFAEPGDYLVICNVRPHFLAGMHALVKVR